MPPLLLAHPGLACIVACNSERASIFYGRVYITARAELQFPADRRQYQSTSSHLSSHLGTIKRDIRQRESLRICTQHRRTSCASSRLLVRTFEQIQRYHEDQLWPPPSRASCRIYGYHSWRLLVSQLSSAVYCTSSRSKCSQRLLKLSKHNSN